MRAPNDARAGENDEPPEDLRSRTDERREQKQSEEELLQLARALVELSDRLLEKLELPPAVLEAVVQARRVRDPSPRHRALRLVRIALRDVDALSIRQRLRDVHAPPRGAAKQGAVEQWRARLVSGGQEDLAAYLAAHPLADRRQIRQLVNNARKAPEASRAARLRALTKALGAVIE